MPVLWPCAWAFERAAAGEFDVVGMGGDGEKIEGHELQNCRDLLARCWKLSTTKKPAKAGTTFEKPAPSRVEKF
jgi:hypothetical protein